MKPCRAFRLCIFLAAGLMAAAAPSIASASVSSPWQTGMRAVGNGATIEPAVNDTNGSPTFLITPNHSPFYDGSSNPTAPVPTVMGRI